MARHAEGHGAVAAHDIDGLPGLLAFSGGQVLQSVLDPGDEPPDPGDLLMRRCCFSARPLIDFGRGQDAFAVAEQVVEVGMQVR